MNTKLIVFEGIDGVGKSSISRGLRDELLKRGVPVVRYEDVEDKEAGFNRIKPFIRDMVPIQSSLHFYVASALYKDGIIRSRLAHEWVICDRYIYSTLAYHAVRGADVSAAGESLAIRKPDRAFLVKVNEGVRLSRLLAREEVTQDDIRPKRFGSLPYKMETYLEGCGLEVLDNTAQGSEALIKRLAGSLLEER